MDYKELPWVTWNKAVVFEGSLVQFVSDQAIWWWQRVKHLWPACRWQCMSRWRKWAEFGVIGGCDHRSTLIPQHNAAVLTEKVSHRGCSFPARTRRHRLAHRPTELAHFCSTSLCPHRHLDVFFLFRAALSLVSVVCVKILLSALRPLSGRRVSTAGAETETLTLFMAR